MVYRWPRGLASAAFWRKKERLERPDYSIYRNRAIGYRIRISGSTSICSFEIQMIMIMQIVN